MNQRERDARTATAPNGARFVFLRRTPGEVLEQILHWYYVDPIVESVRENIALANMRMLTCRWSEEEYRRQMIGEFPPPEPPDPPPWHLGNPYQPKGSSEPHGRAFYVRLP